MFAAIGTYLWQSLIINQKILVDWHTIKTDWHYFDFILIVLAIILLPVNWILEVIKWQVIAQKSNLRLGEAARGVILGLTLDNVLPMGSGSISGRIITLPKAHRIKSVPGILVGQIIQSIITFSFGLYGFVLVWERASTLFNWQIAHSLVLIIALLAIGLSLFFWRDRIFKFMQPLKHYSKRSWLIIFTLSFARYLVFLIQFMILARIFSPELDLALAFGCATWVFSARTFMPKVSNIEGLGIRALAVVFFMNLYNLPPAGLLIAVFLLWFINLAIPSLVGLSFFRSLKMDSLLK